MFDMFGCYAFHEQQKMDIINYLAAAADPNDAATQVAAFKAAGASFNEFSTYEIHEIENEVAKRKANRW